MKLFEPIAIGGMELKNRVVLLPLGLNLGLRGWRGRGYYVERARGGAGALILAATTTDIFIDDNAWGQPGSAEAFVGSLGTIIGETHEHGAKVGSQLWHGNRLPAGRDLETGEGEAVAPSPREDMRELTKEEIRHIVDKFARAAAASKRAGFDFVEFHGAHGYLPNQFFSPLENRRTDEYGGSLEGRMRFGVECIRAMRGAVGPDYPLIFRIAAQDKRSGGMTLAENVEYAAELERAGADAFDVSVGRDPKDRISTVSPGKRAPLGTYVPLAEAIKKRVKVPVIAVGKLNDPQVAEAVIAEGKADLIGLGRQLMADPFWPKKVQEGRTGEVIFCDACNVNCFAPIEYRKLPPDAPLCHLNHRVGREWEVPAPE